MTVGSGDGADRSKPSNRAAAEVGWYKVLASAELGRRELRKVRASGGLVLLARLEDGALAATSVVCPHQAADLSRGRIYMGAIDCPRHHYLYDLRTGRNRYPCDVYPADLAAGLAPLRTYPVREKDGWIWVGIGQA